eukprot:SAG22_NODE_7580_length_727_cov_1.058917_1_plen_89_part_00
MIDRIVLSSVIHIREPHPSFELRQLQSYMYYPRAYQTEKAVATLRVIFERAGHTSKPVGQVIEPDCNGRSDVSAVEPQGKAEKHKERQ